MLLTVISLSLLWSLVEVHSQSFPYASFMGQTLANHSYVDLSLVGDSENDSVQCITDAITFIHHGDWWFPDGNRLPQLPPYISTSGVYEVLGLKRVDLRRRDNSGTPPSGLYHCDIPTGVPFPIGSAMRKRVYVGLYANGGG